LDQNENKRDFQTLAKLVFDTFWARSEEKRRKKNKTDKERVPKTLLKMTFSESQEQKTMPSKKPNVHCKLIMPPKKKKHDIGSVTKFNSFFTFGEKMTPFEN